MRMLLAARHLLLAFLLLPVPAIYAQAAADDTVSVPLANGDSATVTGMLAVRHRGARQFLVIESPTPYRLVHDQQTGAAAGKVVRDIPIHLAGRDAQLTGFSGRTVTAHRPASASSPPPPAGTARCSTAPSSSCPAAKNSTPTSTSPPTAPSYPSPAHLLAPHSQTSSTIECLMPLPSQAVATPPASNSREDQPSAPGTPPPLGQAQLAYESGAFLDSSEGPPRAHPRRVCRAHGPLPRAAH